MDLIKLDENVPEGASPKRRTQEEIDDTYA